MIARCCGLSAWVEPGLPSSAAKGLLIGFGAACACCGAGACARARNAAAGIGSRTEPVTSARCGFGRGSGTSSAMAGSAISPARSTAAAPRPRAPKNPAISHSASNAAPGAPRQLVPVGCGYFATPGGEPCADSSARRMNCTAVPAARLPSQIALFGNQDLALAGMVGLADDALVLHPLHQRGGAVVADLQPALDVAGRGLLVARHDLHGLCVEVAALRLAHAGCVEHG